ncbi:uncharacterized protein [Panulirus ornatus]|uniref:uncharacterized protein n=1 Tax=Panulirus ornatus TaxID=150431 RepID=UPI003A8C72C7
MLPLTYKSSGTLTVRHTRSAVATVDDHTTMKFLVIVFLAAAACASPTEKREAEPSEVVYPYVSYESSNYYRNKRSADPEASDVTTVPTTHMGKVTTTVTRDLQTQRLQTFTTVPTTHMGKVTTTVRRDLQNQRLQTVTTVPTTHMGKVTTTVTRDLQNQRLQTVTTIPTLIWAKLLLPYKRSAEPKASDVYYSPYDSYGKVTTT